MKPALTRALLTCCLAGMAGLPLTARTEPPKDLNLTAELDAIFRLDQIGAASKHVQDLASAPANVVVIRGSELKALGYRTLGEALGGVLGLRSNDDHAYQGLGAAGLYILGDQNTRVLVLLDGHALNSPAEVGSSKVGEDFGLPLELVDHLEVVRGPASSLYGNNAFQALVNVVSLSAAGSQPNRFQGALSTGGGGLAELWAQQNLKLGGVSASLMLSGMQRTGTVRAFPELPVALRAEADREERQSAYLYVQDRQWSLAASALSRSQRLASGPYGSVPGDLGNRYRNRRLAGDFKWQPSSENIRWLVRLFGDRNEFFDAFVKDTPASGAATSQDRDPDHSLGLEVQARAALAQQFSLTFGTEQQFHRYQGVYSNPGAAVSVRTEVVYTVGNTYLEGNWRPSGNWTVVAGLQRADWRPAQVRSQVAGAWQTLPQLPLARLTPRLAILWKPSGADVVKLNYGEGFRFPTLFERYYTDGATQAPNPAIKPEVLTSQQLSWSHSWSPHWNTHLAVSTSALENPIAAGTAAEGLLQYQNGAQSWAGRAVELETTWHQGPTELSAGVGWYDWRQQGTPAANLAPWSGVGKAIQHLGPWSLALEARYLAGRSNPGASGAATQVPANWTLRASLRREFSQGWAQVSLEDLSNSRRRDLVAPEYAPVTWMAGDGRTLRAVLGLRF